jgi:PBP1b-binding outer membrane lipoprotein LpoB
MKKTLSIISLIVFALICSGCSLRERVSLFPDETMPVHEINNPSFDKHVQVAVKVEF